MGRAAAAMRQQLRHQSQPVAIGVVAPGGFLSSSPFSRGIPVFLPNE